LTGPAPIRLLFAGATGLVGSRTLPMLLARGHGVVSLGRRPAGLSHPALTELQSDFRALPTLAAADVAICTLGTTIRAAGSPEAFAAVDHCAVLAFARAARAAGCSQFICVTAVGASVGATAFYSRVKGEVERDLAALGFARLDFLQPGLILGPRIERRPVEAFFQALAPLINPLLPDRFSHFGAIRAEAIAGAATALVGQQAAGVYRHHNKGMEFLSNP
jgi:uncharacterized protein YbjT (DUF2867 family)